ncbi:MAG: hypothetical protein EBS05_17650 [Proteobacteria bacterium]|nr:hypothetical protein [Pseudomonadota bacterium]
MYVFPCASLEDGTGVGDHWFESMVQAEAFCELRYGITAADWSEVPDPDPGCLHDWLAPVRTKLGADGAPQWGKLERRENGRWIEISTPRK